MNGLIDFQCEVYESGYKITAGTQKRILDGKSEFIDGKGEFKIHHYIEPIDAKSPKRIFNLADYPGAYYELADAVINIVTEDYSIMLDSLIKFTNKYGLLTIDLFERPAGHMTIMLLIMARAVLFKDAIKLGELEVIKTTIIREGGEFKIKYPIGMYEDDIIFSTNAQTPPRNYFEAAYHYISNVVNYNLKDSHVTEIIVNKTNTGSYMVVRPKDLLSALWLQIAHSVCRNLEFKQCAACSTFFEVKSKKRKNQKKYCSDRCRVRVGATKRRAKEKARLEKEKEK